MDWIALIVGYRCLAFYRIILSIYDDYTVLVRTHIASSKMGSMLCKCLCGV